jgi:hypothetical protein
MQAPIEEARRELVLELREAPGVTMIGIGECDSLPCLRVYVVELTAELRARIPDEHRGWKVDVRESGRIEAFEPP